MPETRPPHPHELEVSLFGPGVGECVVIHLGNGEWMVVDSCRSSDGKAAVALEYLERLGVDVARQLRLIVVTHWHDDHIRGLAQIMQKAKSAQFACSAALLSKEFLTLVAADREIKLIEHSSGISEFADVLDILEKRTTSRYPVGPDYWAHEGSLLYRRPDHGVTVTALSPSHQTITDSKGAIASMIPTQGEPIRRFYRPDPNELSVVVMVSTPGINLLLGADLERGSHRTRGWQAVINSTVKPERLSHIYKVAHHGSPGADLEEIWTELLADQVYAMVSPYARMRVPLPSPDDVKRMKQYTENIFCTGPATKSPPRRDPSVERTIKEMVKTHRAIRKRSGHLRARVPLHGRFPSDVTLDLIDGAVKL